MNVGNCNMQNLTRGFWHAQVHDSSNQGLQFGQSGGLNFGNFGSETAGSIDALKPPQTSQLEHQTSSQHVGSAPSNQGLDVFTGM